jgi:hypothetical protein
MRDVGQHWYASILKTTTQHSICDATVGMSGISDYKTSHQTGTSHLTFIFYKSLGYWLLHGEVQQQLAL